MASKPAARRPGAAGEGSRRGGGAGAHPSALAHVRGVQDHGGWASGVPRAGGVSGGAEARGEKTRAFSILTNDRRESVLVASPSRSPARFGDWDPRISRFATPKNADTATFPSFAVRAIPRTARAILRGEDHRAHRSDERNARGDLVHHAQARGDADVQVPKLGVMKLEMDALPEKNAATGGCVIRGPDARRRDPRDATSDPLTLPTDHRYDAGSVAAHAGDHPATPSPTVRRSDTARVYGTHRGDTPIFVAPRGGFFPPNGYRRRRTRETYLRDRATPRRRGGSDPDAATPRPDAGTREETRGGAVAAHPRAAPLTSGASPGAYISKRHRRFAFDPPTNDRVAPRVEPAARLTVSSPRAFRSKQPIFPSATRNISRPRRPWT